MLAKVQGVRGGHNKSSTQSTPQPQKPSVNTSPVQKESNIVQTSQTIITPTIIPTIDTTPTAHTDIDITVSSAIREAKRVEVKRGRKPKGLNPKQLNKQAMMAMIENKPPGIARPKVWCEVCNNATDCCSQAETFVDKTRVV